MKKASKCPRKRRVYIVDDDESVCRAIKCLLMTFGFEVSTFLSADKFFSAVPDNAQGCLILDIHMPGMDAWEVLGRITRSGYKRQFIIVTADKNGGSRERALKAGAVGFLQKPFNDRELVDLIKIAIKKDGSTDKTSPGKVKKV